MQYQVCYVCLEGASHVVPVEVQDVIDYSGVGVEPASYTKSQCTLGGQWRVMEGEGVHPVRFDWSVSLDGAGPGGGLMDTVNQAVWREAYLTTKAVFTTASSLQHGNKIIIFRREHCMGYLILHQLGEIIIMGYVEIKRRGGAYLILIAFLHLAHCVYSQMCGPLDDYKRI